MLLAVLNAVMLAGAPQAPQGAAIMLELGRAGGYLPGDSVSARVHVANDGYLLVLRADAGGRVRVLFPLDPTDDAFVRGGRSYDILSRGDRPFTFLAETNGGTGTILAAISSDPLSPGQYALNGHWDYRVLGSADDDDELALRTIAEKMIPTRFEYDVLPYQVEGAELPMASASADGGSMTTLAIGVGGCWNCFGGWWGAGWGWGLGWGWGWGWSPVWAWGPVWGWGPGWGGGGTWGGGWGTPGWTPGNPGGPDRSPGLGPAEPTPYRPRAAAGGRSGDLGVRGSLASSGTGYRSRAGSGDVGVRGTFASSATGYRGRAVTSSRGESAGARAYAGGRGVRAQVPGRSTTGYGGRGATMGSRGYSSPSGMGGRTTGTASRGAVSAPRGGGYSGGSTRGVSGGSRGASGSSRGFSGGSRGFSGGSRGFSGGGGRGR